MRAVARLVLVALLVASLLATGLSVAGLAADPGLRPFREAAAAEIVAATDRLLAREATPERLTALIEARLAETPRNWLALDALEELAGERSIPLPAELTQALQAARDEESGFLAQSFDCARCAFDASQCALDKVILCHGPVALSPVGDIFGVSRAGIAWLDGTEVDEIDLALSIVGLGATAAILVSGGTSASLKTGAAVAKTARKMGRLSPRLMAMTEQAVREGVDWSSLPAARSVADLNRAVRPQAFEAITNTLHDLSRLNDTTDARTALHLLPLVDDAGDARKLARSAEALQGRLVGRAEVLGKTRLFRTTIRLSNAALSLLASLAGLALALAGLAGSVGQSLALRSLRRVAR